MTLGVAVVLRPHRGPRAGLRAVAAAGAWRRASAALLPLPPDAREQLDESKRAALRALRELEFEHASGHVSDADYADLRARYESEAAAILSELDRLEPARPAEAPTPTPAVAATIRRRGWRHPVAVTVGAVALVTFGVALGVGIVRFTEPEHPWPGPPARGGPMMEEPSAANAPARAGDARDARRACWARPARASSPAATTRRCAPTRPCSSAIRTTWTR